MPCPLSTLQATCRTHESQMHVYSTTGTSTGTSTSHQIPTHFVNCRQLTLNALAAPAAIWRAGGRDGRRPRLLGSVSALPLPATSPLLSWLGQDTNKGRSFCWRERLRLRLVRFTKLLYSPTSAQCCSEPHHDMKKGTFGKRGRQVHRRPQVCDRGWNGLDSTPAPLYITF